VSPILEDVAQITGRVRDFVLENFYVEDQQVRDDTSLIVSGIVDSTGMLEVIAFLEATFGIAVEDQDAVAANLETIGRIAAFVARKRTVSSPPTSQGA
jgi:acyl carrier protein